LDNKQKNMLIRLWKKRR